MKKTILPILFIFFLAGEGYCQSTLLNYQSRIHRAVEQVERIKKDEAYTEEGISAIKSLIPAGEKVTIDNRTVDVDNKWLYDELKVFESVRLANDNTDEILENLKNKLSALNQHLIEAEDISKEQLNKQELNAQVKKILADDKYREKKDNWLTAKIKEIRRRVLEMFSELMLKLWNALFGASSQGGWAIRGLFIVLLGVVGYFVFRMAMQFKWAKKRPKKKTVLGEEIDEHMTPKDFADAAVAAAKAGDFRTGIRKLYIALLYELSERNLIELDAHATNHEYLTKVARFSTLLPAMNYLTDRFDYFWYGMFPTNEQDFSSYLSSYQEAVKQAQSISQQQAERVA
ncbi:MAG: DUF4129 domain-containing protein [Acidobacteriota bacterium]